MRLKKLNLQGYKTFASKQEFIFDDGITSIVGPNGSGKSNIADALRWVLGEQSFSQLRGKRGTDMIFAGSTQRPRAGMAQAILTLDNSDGWLPIDYAEVEIGRRTYQSGDNEYLLNGQRVRLRDINELLAKGGLAEATYAIIGQGLVDRALSLKSEERRSLFEEAAGITHYKARRAQALRQLQETQRNLQRIHDILSEIRPRLSSLKRQANRAENYEQVAEDLRHLLRIFYGFQWDKAKDGLREWRQAAGEAEAKWQDSRAQLLNRQSAMERLRARIGTLQGQDRAKQRERDAVREQWEGARRETAVMSERRTLLQRQLVEVEGEMPAFSQRLTTAQTDLQHALSDLENAQNRLRDEESELAQFASSFAQQQVEIRGWQEKLTGLTKRQRRGQDLLAQAEGQLSQLQERLSEKTGQVVDEDAITVAETALTDAQAAVKEAETALKAIRGKRSEAQKARREIASQLKQERRRGHDVNQRVNRLQKELGRLEAQGDMLDNMRQKGVKTPKGVDVLGQFASYLTIPSAYQTAISAGLGAQLTTLLTEDDKDLWQLVERSKGAFSAVALDDLEKPSSPKKVTEKGVIGWAIDEVKVKKEARVVAKWLLGRVLLVESRKTAVKVAREDLPVGCLAVTPDGLVVQAGGIVVVNPTGGRDDVLAQEKQWREAIKKRDEAREALAKGVEDAGMFQNQLNDLQSDLDKFDNTDRDRQREEQQANQVLSKLQRESDRARQNLTYLKRQRDNLGKEQAELAERVATTESNIAKMKGDVGTFAQEIQVAEVSLAALPVAELKQERQNRQGQIEATRTIVAGRQAVVDSRRASLQQAEIALGSAGQRQAGGFAVSS